MILASRSPRRAQLLQEAGFEFRIMEADIDESAVTATDPCDLVRERARRKAASVMACADNNEIIVASDTAVVLGDTVLGKPHDDDDARMMLRLLSGKTHYVATAVSICRGEEEQCCFVERCDVTFWDLTDEGIDAYVASGEPRDKAGAYGIQGLGRLLVKTVNGDYYTVVGLPIARLVRELDMLGIRPTDAYHGDTVVN